MTRGLVLGTLALLFASVPATAATLGLESGLDAKVAANDTRALNLSVDREAALTIEGGLFAPPAGDRPTPASVSGPTAPGPTEADVPAAAAAVGAAALLTAAVALAAFYWGQIKIATLGLLAPLFSRIQGDHLLDNGVRQRVHQAVVENPGITLKEVAATVGIGWGTAVHHLGRLEHERLIVSERNRQYRRFYKNGGGIVNEQKAAFGELKHPTCQRIAVTILAHPGRCQKEVCQEVGISAPLAHRYLGRLHEVGLIESQREWKSVKYFPTPRLQQLLAAAHPVSPVPVLAALA